MMGGLMRYDGGSVILSVVIQLARVVVTLGHIIRKYLRSHNDIS